MASMSTLSPGGRCFAVAHRASVWLSGQRPAAPPTNVLELPDPAVEVALGHARVFAITEAGVLVMGDRSGQIEIRRRIGARGVGVGCYGDHVVAFSDHGWLRWRIDDGPGGHWGRERFVEVDGVVAGACMGDGRVAVLTDGGELRVHDAEDRRCATIDVGEATAVAPGGPAGWFVARGEEVVQVLPSGRVRPIVVGNTPVGQLAASANGQTLAIALGDELVGFWSVLERELRARVQVFDRQVTGLSFGPGDVVGIGLDLGDGNLIDLATQRITRNQPPIGLVRRTWGVAMTVEEAWTAAPAIGPDDRTVGASQSLLRRPEPRWRWAPAKVIGVTALWIGGLLTGWMFGQVVTP